MNTEYFGNIPYYRPKPSSELELRLEAETHLRSQYPTGIYREAKEINDIVQYLFSFYKKKLNEILPQIASRGFLEFLLFQYDQSFLINSLFKKKLLSPSEMASWSKIGAQSRRAIKYMAENIILLQPTREPDFKRSKLVKLVDYLWIAAEEMVELYLLSDQTINIFPDSSTLEILPEAQSVFFKLTSSKEFAFLDLVNRDRENKASYLGEGISPFELNMIEHSSFMDEAMKLDIGATYKECLSLIANLIQDAEPVPNGLPVVFVNNEYLVHQLSQFSKIQPAIIERILSGFTLTKKNMELEERQLWKPKQEYRAFRRGFFLLQDEGAPHIAFSKHMAKENLTFLIISVVYQHLPPEWCGSNTQKALAAISNKAGKWFEGIVIKNLKEIGILGRSYKNKIGNVKNYIEIPSGVGEIDFLGYSESEQTLFILECKMVNSGTEPKFYRKDIETFVLKKNSYLKQFEKKHQWINQNLQQIIDILNTTKEFNQSTKVKKLATGFITLSPSIATYFIEQYPCVSLTNLMEDYAIHKSWPYSLGVTEIS